MSLDYNILSLFYLFMIFPGSLVRILKRLVALVCTVLERNCLIWKMNVNNGNNLSCVLSLWDLRVRQRDKDDGGKVHNICYQQTKTKQDFRMQLHKVYPLEVDGKHLGRWDSVFSNALLCPRIVPDGSWLFFSY